MPLIAERGYHVVIPDPSLGIRASLMPSDGHMGVVSTPQGLRLAGPVELAAPTAAPDWRRAEILLGYARKMLLTQAPATAEFVAALIGAHEPPFDPAPYAARRFAR